MKTLDNNKKNVQALNEEELSLVTGGVNNPTPKINK